MPSSRRGTSGEPGLPEAILRAIDGENPTERGESVTRRRPPEGWQAGVAKLCWARAMSVLKIADALDPEGRADGTTEG